MKKSTFTQEFSDWLERVSKGRKPAKSVVAFNIGLFETEEGYMAYLTGAKHYSEEDRDWSCDEDFASKEKYFVLPEQHFKNKTWEEALKTVIRTTKAFMKSPRLADSFLIKAEAITVGFDDGDLFRVK